MKLGGKRLIKLFDEDTWKAYRGDQQMSMEELSPLIKANSIDVTLNNVILTPKLGKQAKFVDLHDPGTLEWDRTEFDTFLLRPNRFVLSNVRERFDCDSHVILDDLYPSKSYFVQMYEGRSTVGRLGIESHMTAGFGDYQFKGSFTLEIVNNLGHPIMLRAGMRIGQVAFEEVVDPISYEGAYDSKNVKHNHEPVPPVLGKDRF